MVVALAVEVTAMVEAAVRRVGLTGSCDLLSDEESLSNSESPDNRSARTQSPVGVERVDVVTQVDWPVHTTIRHQVEGARAQK